MSNLHLIFSPQLFVLSLQALLLVTESFQSADDLLHLRFTLLDNRLVLFIKGPEFLCLDLQVLIKVGLLVDLLVLELD